MSQLIKKIRTDQGDLQIDYNALANLPTISNPNLLINGDFRNPVNQRGKTTYECTGANKVYGIDRWAVSGAGAKMVVNKNYLSVTLPANCDFVQGLEVKYTSYHAVTISVKFYNDSVVRTAVLANLSSMAESTESFVNLTSSIKVGFFVFGHGMYVFLRPTSGQTTLNIEWIKLEQGVNATAFVPRPYAEELIMCQRYAYVLAPMDHYTLAYHIFKSDANDINFSVKFPFDMRSTPSLHVLGGGVSCVANDDFGTVYGSTSISMDTANACAAKVKATFGVTLWKDCPVEFFAYSSLGLLFDAEFY